MIPVFESFDFSEAGRIRSLLEEAGIRTFMRNEFASSVMGEMPFVEVVPQVFVLRDEDAGRARLLVQAHTSPPPEAGSWKCANCGAEVENQFAACWNCAVPAPA